MSTIQWLSGKQQALLHKQASLADVTARLESQDYSIDVASWRQQWTDAREGFRYSEGAAIMIGRQAINGIKYRKKVDMSHVVRHRLHKEADSVMLTNASDTLARRLT